MSFQHIPGIGTVHFNEVKPPRVVPGQERHKWAGKPGWGESTTCIKCGCVKTRKKPEYIETYKVPGGEVVTERPVCSTPTL
jgi:hypothetical protein